MLTLVRSHTHTHEHTHANTYMHRDVDTSDFAGGEGVDLVGEIWKSISDLQSKENFIHRDGRVIPISESLVSVM